MGLYRLCGDSQKGKSHETNGTLCQDANYFIERADFVVAAVADGLGSSKHSDIASNIAAKSTVDYCADKIITGMPDNDILSIIKNAFDNANFAIKRESGGHLDDYDTTLTLAVFISGTIYFGHAGDSGIIALRHDGIFEQVTEPQLGSGYGKERPVYPLAAESHWVFGKYKHRTRAIFMMTDGVINKVIPPLLEDQEHRMDHEYLYYLYTNLCKNHDLVNWISDELSLIKPQEINYDDKTLVAVLCETVDFSPQSEQYYKFPGTQLWEHLLDMHNKELYPTFPPTAAPPFPPPPTRYRKASQFFIIFLAGVAFGILVAVVFMSVTGRLNRATDAFPPPPIESQALTPTPSLTPTSELTPSPTPPHELMPTPPPFASTQTSMTTPALTPAPLPSLFPVDMPIPTPEPK